MKYEWNYILGTLSHTIIVEKDSVAFKDKNLPPLGDNVVLALSSGIVVLGRLGDVRHIDTPLLHSTDDKKVERYLLGYDHDDRGSISDCGPCIHENIVAWQSLDCLPVNPVAVEEMYD